MPHYPKNQSDENLDKIRHNNVCAECGRQVFRYMSQETLPNGRKKEYIACSGQVHEGIAREYKPPVEDYRSNIRKEAELEKEVGLEKSKALATIPKQGQLTQPQAEHILNLIYPDAKQEEILRTAIFCRDFGLHPLANEVYLIPFKSKWVMVVGIKASRKMAHALKGDFSFLDDSPRAATEKEIIKQYGKDSDEAKSNTISVTKLEGVGGNKAIGFGLWPNSEKPYGMDKGNTVRNMANIRSERQATDRLPGRSMPQIEVIDEAYVKGVGEVDKKTGEIIEAEVTEVEETTINVNEAIAKDEPAIPIDDEGVTLSPNPAVTREELKELFQLMKEKGKDLMAVGEYCNVTHDYHIRHLEDLTKSQYDTVIKALKEGNL